MSASESNESNAHELSAHTATRKRRGWLYPVAALLSLVGLADAIYLTVKHLTGQSVRCTILSGCDVVLGSSYATLGGYPLAALGALAYFAVFSLAILAVFGYRAARTLLLIVVGLMTLMTLRLLYLQAFVLEHYCEFCMLSAIITLSLACLMVISILPRRHGDTEVKRERDKISGH